MTRVRSVEDVLAAATAQPGPEAPSAETVEAVCGPHPGAADRMISAWKQGLKTRRAIQTRPDTGSAATGS